jgi:YD repeat-containing protein
MKKLFCSLFILFGFLSLSQSQENEKANYDLAYKFSPKSIAKLVHSTAVRPHWLKNGNKFWYQYKTTAGSKYYIVDADRRSKSELFDNDKMAAWLTEITKDPYDGKHLPKFSFKFVKNETAIRFRVTSNELVKNNDTLKKSKEEKKVFYLEYKLGGNGLTIINNKKKKEEKWKKWANVSPDSTIVLYSKKFNLYWMDKENFLKAVEDEKDSTIVENQWTKDGVEHYGYGGYGRGLDNEDIEKRKNDRFPIRGYWSSDSKKFIFQKLDNRKIKDLWVINSTGKKRPTLETYKYHMAGEEAEYKHEILIFDIDNKGINKVKIDSLKQKTISYISGINIYSKPRKPSTIDDDFKPTLLLSDKGKIYFSLTSRDRKKVDICRADINSGEMEVLIEERMNTYIETRPLYLIKNETEMIHWSERDGWAHFYRYDNQGNLINRITKGSYHSDYIKHYDGKSNSLFFTAHGVDNQIDPYYEHTYKISLSGGGTPKLLNKGNFNTMTYPSDNHRYFVNNFSRVNTTPESHLLNSDGTVIMKLEIADLSALFETGYKFPETFKAKADDGITDLYGVIYKPFDFDENKKYPLLEYVYPGPQTEAVNKSFSVRMDRLDRMAQLGFIVITLGNRGGHPDRSKWYHNYGYGNLRDYGLADKKYVAQQLANRHSFIDIDRVGIYGHSGGGFMSTAAILVYPDFFKVAYSQAGNHDNSMYNSWWSETHHGIMEETDKDGNIKYKYDIDKNQSLAKNLKGHLFLVTGDMDNNVHPGATLRMANALIKENKKFEFMILPSQRHGFGNMTEYNFWLRANHFSKYFLNDENSSVDMLEMNRDIPQSK